MKTDLQVEQRQDGKGWNVVRGAQILGWGRTKDEARRVRFEVAKGEAKHGKGTKEAIGAAFHSLPDKCHGIPCWDPPK